MSKEKVTKVESAKRQLKTAIRLFFDKGDAISVHTLVSAAHQILHDICKKKEIDVPDIHSMIPGEHKQLWIDTIRYPQNYFKHSDKDPEDVLTFVPLLSQLFLIHALHAYRALTGKLFPEAIAFNMWGNLQYPTKDQAIENIKSQLNMIPGSVKATDLDIFKQLIDHPKFQNELQKHEWAESA